jgi:hypothetical protein
VNFDLGQGTYDLSSAGNFDIFVSKFDSAGNFLWADSAGTPDSEAAYGVSTDSAGSIYVTGGFQGTMDFDPGPGTAYLTSIAPSNGSDLFVWKLDSNGNYVWATHVGNANYTSGYAIAVDGSGNVYVGGLYTGTVNFDPGPGTFNLTSTSGPHGDFLLKLDSLGNFVWARDMGGGANDTDNLYFPLDVELDSAGNVYFAGAFNGAADLGALTATSSGDYDAFVTKLDGNGNFLWTHTMGGSQGDFADGVAVDSSGDVYTTGFFASTDFSPNPGSPTLASNGSFDFFLVRLTPGSDAIPVTVPVTVADYKFSGFLPPLNKNLNFAAGRTVPVKFQLTDVNGNFISSLNAVTAIQVIYPDLSTHPISGLRYDCSANQFVANWDTKGLGAGSYTISLSLLDGTTHTVTVQVTTKHGSGALTTDTAGGAGSSAGALLGGDIELFVDNSNGLFTSDELARIDDAVAAVDAVIAPDGVTITEVTDSNSANVVLNTDTTSAVGGYADGVLGCTTDTGTITLIQGWNWYASSDATQIGPNRMISRPW